MLISGKRHLKNVERLERMELYGDPDVVHTVQACVAGKDALKTLGHMFRCDVCDISLSGEQPLQAHLNGKNLGQKLEILILMSNHSNNI